jgi:hypothetical protein
MSFFKREAGRVHLLCSANIRRSLAIAPFLALCPPLLRRQWDATDHLDTANANPMRKRPIGPLLLRRDLSVIAHF